MSRCPFAEWRPVPNYSPGGMTILGLCPHVIVGSLAGADATFHNGDRNQGGGRRSAHFGVGKDGRLVQWVDTDDRAWAQAAGNPFYVSAECEGTDAEAHTAEQVAALARLLAWLHGTHGVALAVADTPGERGVISHRDGGAAWGGHSCPGDQRHAQRGQIVADARALVDSNPQPQVDPQPLPEDDMIATDPTTGDYWVLTGPEGGIDSYNADGTPGNRYFGNPIDHPEYGVGPGRPLGPAVGIAFWPQGVDGGGYVIFSRDPTGHVHPYRFDRTTRKS